MVFLDLVMTVNVYAMYELVLF